ncbi:hypothetical protein SAMN06265173_14818 [Thalassovita litoralis]|uniref:Uncharacterized protein n=2 Tax=Thalassovita litoralis TaxID=1010611 RepID=A0A521FS41_9RHOB|nr:hypothetical protein SAMN06265173_14818 [Thalassovita litoralis]
MAGQQVRGLGAKKIISIHALLEWAFRRECARLDFAEDGESILGYGYASMTAMILRHEQLGCRIDGGGRSEPHPDADAVAAAVSALPEARGGRRMAVWIAELARAGAVPDWMPDAAPRVYPVETHTNRYGIRAKTEDAARLGAHGWPMQSRRNRKGQIVQEAVLFCPVSVRPTVADIARARRSYLDWWGALHELRCSFQIYSGLSSFDVSCEMPPRAPWLKNVDGELLGG